MTGSTISVVLPVRNEVESIESAISSIAAQEVSAPLEIVVADGMSTDGTRQLLERLATADERLVVVDNPAGATPSGLNAAITASSGDIVIRCDAHSELPPGYIARVVDGLADNPTAGNIGGIQRAVGVTPFQRAVAAGMTTPLGVGDARFHRGGQPGPVDTVYLGAFRREVLEQVGTYDESLVRNQDYDLNNRIRQGGHVVYFDPELAVTYRPRQSPMALASQYFQYGRWKRVVIGRDPKTLRWRQLAPPALVVALIASLVALLLGSAVGFIIPGIYSVAVSATTVTELVRSRDGAVAALVLVLPIMHLSWGCGFLLGRSGAGTPRVGSVS